MRLIVQSVFSGTGALSNVEIVIGQVQPGFANLRQESTIAVERGIETALKHLIGLRRRRPELQDLERSELGEQLAEKREKTLVWSGLEVILVVLRLVSY